MNRAVVHEMGSRDAMRGLFAVLGLVTAGCGFVDPTSAEFRTFQGETMGTMYEVTVVESPVAPDAGEHLGQLIDDQLSGIDSAMSTYDPESELSRFNRSLSTEWFPVSGDTFRVFQHAREISELSGGAFDVTVGSLVEAWGFGPSGQADAIPSDDEIERLLGSVGYQRIELDETIPAIRKTSPAVSTDLSAIAKGYAVDRVAELLDREGHESYLVEIGGEVRARGRHPDGRPWRVGIERPGDGPTVVRQIVTLTDAALATSGDYRNYFQRDGVRFSHTIDPRTGRPVTHGLASVSVIDPLCVRADAVATALEVLGPEDGYALAVERDWAVLLMIRQADGDFHEQMSPAFLDSTTG